VSEEKLVKRRVLAFDFDGTLAENGVVPAALQHSLERLHASGHSQALFGKMAQYSAI
jgi:hydroxymethylpyrimidine pyrophosphatase-like HAD family hydrolase